MYEPEEIYRLDNRTRSGSLKSYQLSEIHKILRFAGFGFVIVPSDTCYAIAAFADSTLTKGRIDKVLSRNGEPISLCCTNYEEVMRWAASNVTVLALMEALTPGPLTVVCKPGKVLQNSWFDGVIGSSDRTIGLRIPDSGTERDVAAIQDQFLVTTAAIRDNREPVCDLDRAMQIVTEGLKRLHEPARWAAIEGTFEYKTVSTVVRVRPDESLELIREGDIPFNVIKQHAKRPPIRLPSTGN